MLQKRSTFSNALLSDNISSVRQRYSKSNNKLINTKTEEDQPLFTIYQDSLITQLSEMKGRNQFQLSSLQVTPQLRSPKLISPKQTDDTTPNLGTPKYQKKDELKYRLSKIFVNNSPQEYLIKYMKSLNKSSFSNLLTMRNQKTEQDFQQRQKTILIHQKQEQMENFINLVENKKTTILNYGFRSTEKQNNMYIRPLMKLVNKNMKNNHKATGSMFVVDLWSDKNIKMVLERQNICKDKFLINRLGDQTKQKEKSKYAKSLVLEKRKDFKLVRQIYKHNLTIKSPKGYDLVPNQEDIKSSIRRKESKAELQRNKSESGQLLIKLLSRIDEFHNSNITLYDQVNEKIKKISK